MMEDEKLLFIIYHILSGIPVDIENVLNDSLEDPHFSAVHTTSLIKICIELLKQLNRVLPYEDVLTFFEHNGFSKKEYEIFEKKRYIESKYYIGKQF